MPGMGLTLSLDPTPVLIFSSAFITTIVSTTDYTLTTWDSMTGRNLDKKADSVLHNILYQSLRIKFVPEISN